MPTTTPGGLPIPEDTDPVEDGADAIRDLAAAVEAWLSFTGTEVANVGANPPAGTHKIIKQGYTVGAIVGAGGGLTITFNGGAFPNGVVGFVAMVGDSANAAVTCQAVQASATLGTALVQVRNAAGAFIAAGLNVRVNYVAIGW